MSLRGALPWVLIGAIGWGYLLTLGLMMAATEPPTAGFDLELLLQAARDAAAGRSLYDPAMIAGASVGASSLFYSYPPWVAQVLVPLSGLPSALVLVGWGVAAVAAMVAVGAAVARRFGAAGSTASIVLPLVATAPFVFPFSIGLLFGNLNAWFPALYGLLLLGAVPSVRDAPEAAARRPAVAAGVALALAAASKLHPASLGVWFLLRGRRTVPRPWLVVVVAAAAGLAMVVVSLLVGGAAPWIDYLAVVRAGTGADLIDRRNAAPAVLVGTVLGLDAGGVRILQVLVSLSALGVTAWAALRRADPLESLSWAAVASLVTLPVTWYHYPAALIPFGIAAIARTTGAKPAVRRRTLALIGAALVTALAAIAAIPLIWASVVLLLAAIRVSDPKSTSGDRP